MTACVSAGRVAPKLSKRWAKTGITKIMRMEVTSSITVMIDAG